MLELSPQISSQPVTNGNQRVKQSTFSPMGGTALKAHYSSLSPRDKFCKQVLTTLYSGCSALSQMFVEQRVLEDTSNIFFWGKGQEYLLLIM